MGDARLKRSAPCRRDVLRVGGASLVVVGVGGCDALSTDPDTDGADGGDNGQGQPADDKGSEAPMLARLVEQGDLPPVEERLPDSPLVVEPTEQTGAYGGAWNSVLLGTSDTSWLSRTIGYETLLRWDPDWTDVVPNVAESIEVSDDDREFVIRLRAGMKWSDGRRLPG